MLQRGRRSQLQPLVPGEQVADRLPAYQHPSPAVPHRHQRRPAHHVERRRHAVVVGAGAGHRQQVAGVQVGRQLARRWRSRRLPRSTADDGDRLRRRQADAGWRRVTVYCAPYRATRGLSLMPPSTATKVRPPGWRLHRHHPVQRHAGAGADGAAGLDHDHGRGKRSAAQAASSASSMTSRQLSRSSSRSPATYGTPCPPPMFSSGQDDAVLGADVGHRRRSSGGSPRRRARHR